MIGAPLVLGAAGFGAGGVAAGSLAAKAQAVFYGGGTTGIFSILQSAGAAGMSSSANVVIAGVGNYVGSYFCDLDIPPESSTPAESLPKDASATSQETKSKDDISEIKEFLNENKYKMAGAAAAVLGAPLAAGAAVGAAAAVGAVGAAGAAFGAAGAAFGAAGFGTAGLGTAGLGAAGLASAASGIVSSIDGLKSKCPARGSKSKVPVIFCSEDGQCSICQ